jgi:mannose-1-phosphate guanylyltransferase
LTRALAGHDVPKQFCAIFGRDTLLQMTLRRVALAIDPARIFTVVTRSHERFFSPLIAEFPHRPLVIQPGNRGTAVAIAYAAFRVAELYPSAAIAIFPSDHWFSDDAWFMRSVECAFELVAQFQEMTVALGLAAERPESGYGWFELGERLATLPAPLFKMRCFHEKPPTKITRSLWDGGARRNSFVLVATASALLNLILETLPRLYFAFHAIRPTLGTLFEEKTVESLYRDLPALEFSEHVLAASPRNVAVLPVDNVEWSDLGEPRRVLAVLKRIQRGGSRLIPGG